MIILQCPYIIYKKLIKRETSSLYNFSLVDLKYSLKLMTTKSFNSSSVKIFRTHNIMLTMRPNVLLD